jgi:hypothetical protein
LRLIRDLGVAAPLIGRERLELAPAELWRCPQPRARPMSSVSASFTARSGWKKPMLSGVFAERFGC